MLKSAVLGGGAGIVAATALGSLGPETAFGAAAPEVAPGAPDTNFAEGRIRQIKGNMLLVLGSNMVFHNIRVVDGTSLWKLGPVAFDEARPGDGLYARGVRMPDGVLAAESVWLNIVNIKGHLRNITAEKLHLDHKGQEILCHRVVAGKSVAALQPYLIGSFLLWAGLVKLLSRRARAQAASTALARLAGSARAVPAL